MKHHVELYSINGSNLNSHLSSLNRLTLINFHHLGVCMCDPHPLFFLCIIPTEKAYKLRKLEDKHVYSTERINKFEKPEHWRVGQRVF